MTLEALEAKYGVPAAVIRSKLGLPESAPLDERLGRLRDMPGHEFEPSDVREIIDEYQAGRPAVPPTQE